MRLAKVDRLDKDGQFGLRMQHQGNCHRRTWISLEKIVKNT